MHQALVVVAAAVVAVVATLDEIDTEIGTGTEISIEMIEFLPLGGMNLLHLGVIVVEGVEGVIGVRVRGPVRSAHHREEETVMIDLSLPSVAYDLSSGMIILDFFFFS